MPLALASAAILVLFMTFPAFDPRAYPQSDMMGGPLPQPAGMSGPMDPSAEQMPAAGHGGSQTAAPAHGGGPTPAPVHGESTPPAGHGGDQAPSASHPGGQSAATPHTGPSADALQDRFNTARLTTATGYVATGLLALTLLIGPVNLMLRRRNPVSSYLRRDVGAWTAAFSVIHVIFGLQVHGGGQLSGFLAYFLTPDGTPLLNSFGLGNWTGLAGTVIVAGLLAISSDFALRSLKSRTWKWLQRLNYALFALVILHAFFYGALVRMTSPFTLLLLTGVIAVLVGQMVGVGLYRRRHIRRTTDLSARAGSAPSRT